MSKEEKYTEWLKEITSWLMKRSPQINNVVLYNSKRSALYFQVSGGYGRYTTFWVDPVLVEREGIEEVSRKIEEGLLTHGWDKKEHPIFEWEFRYEREA